MFLGCPVRQVRLGGNQIDDRLRLGQIDPAVEESPLGKFPGLSRAGAGRHGGAEDQFHVFLPAVALDLQDILTGITAGGSKEKKDHFVNDLFLRRNNHPQTDFPFRPGGYGFS